MDKFGQDHLHLLRPDRQSGGTGADIHTTAVKTRTV